MCAPRLRGLGRLPYSAPAHAFEMVSSSLGAEWPATAPEDAAVRRAAEVLNAGEKIAVLAGAGARGARTEVMEVTDLLGVGVAEPLLGTDVLSGDLPYVTGSIGLLGSRPSYAMMKDCDTLWIVGSGFPYSQFLPEFGQARSVQIDIPLEGFPAGDARAALGLCGGHVLRAVVDEEEVGGWGRSPGGG